MINQLLLQYLSQHNLNFEHNISLSKKTWIKTGGMCSYWIVPQTKAQLTELCRYLYSNKIKFDIVGQTSNIFFHSTYCPDVVVSTVKVNNYVIGDGFIDCDCGVSVIKLAKDCLERGYAGFYGLVGLPGTVASSVYNNAGCFNCSISSMVESVEWLSPKGTVQWLQPGPLGLSSRSSAFKRKEMEGVLLSVRLKVNKAADIENEKMKSEETVNYRKTKQEGPYKNLGSVFCEMTMRRNIRNNIVMAVTRIVSAMRIRKNLRLFRKKLLLSIYGYNDLDRYISDKDIKTFVWKDEHAESQFIRYKEFMGKVYTNLVIEI